MKVLHLTDHYPDEPDGGVPRHVRDLHDHLIRSGRTSVIGCLDGDETSGDVVVGCHERVAGSSVRSRLRAANRNLTERILVGGRSRGVTLIHLHDHHLAESAFQLGNALRVPVVYTVHTDLSPNLREFDRELPLGVLAKHDEDIGSALKRCDAAIFVSESSRRAVGSRHEIGKPSYVIGNGIDESLVRRDLRRRPDGHALIQVGAISAVKNLPLSLSVMELLPQQWRLKVMGPMSASTQECATMEIRRRALDGRVTLLGAVPRSHIISEMDVAFALLVPSFVETFSLAALEAQARGLPVACFAEGVAERLTRGSGLLMESLEPELWAQELRSLDDLRWALVSRHAMASAASFTWKVLFPRIIDVYERACYAYKY